MAATEGEKGTLELAAREVGVGAQIGFRDQAEIQRSPNRCTEHRLGNAAVQIAERSRRLGDRDAVATGRNSGDEGVGSVDRDALALPPAPIPWDGHMDPPPMRPEHGPDRGGAVMTEDRPTSNGKGSRHATPFESEIGVAHGVNTAMNAVQAAGDGASAHCFSAEPGRRELGRADDSVLASGDSRDHQVAFGSFVTHSVTKAPTAVLLPFIAGFRAK